MNSGCIFCGMDTHPQNTTCDECAGLLDDFLFHAIHRERDKIREDFIKDFDDDKRPIAHHRITTWLEHRFEEVSKN